MVSLVFSCFCFGNAIAQRCQRAVHLAVEMQRVPFPGFAEFVELLQPFAQPGETQRGYELQGVVLSCEGTG